MRVVKGLGLPILLLGLFAASTFLNADTLLGQADVGVIRYGRSIWRYAQPIGLWLSAAFLLNRLLALFIWTGVLIPKTGRPIPKLYQLRLRGP